MKIQLLSLLSMFLLVSCETGPLDPSLESGWNPLSCTSQNKEACGVDWYINLKSEVLPENLQVLFNEQVVIDECDPKSYWTTSTTSQMVEFKLSDYADLNGDEPLSMRVFDMRNCSDDKREIGYYANQKYTIKNVSGEKRIVIERDL